MSRQLLRKGNLLFCQPLDYSIPFRVTLESLFTHAAMRACSWYMYFEFHGNRPDLRLGAYSNSPLANFSISLFP